MLFSSRQQYGGCLVKNTAVFAKPATLKTIFTSLFHIGSQNRGRDTRSSGNESGHMGKTVFIVDDDPTQRYIL